MQVGGALDVQRGAWVKQSLWWGRGETQGQFPGVFYVSHNLYEKKVTIRLPRKRRAARKREGFGHQPVRTSIKFETKASGTFSVIFMPRR